MRIRLLALTIPLVLAGCPADDDEDTQADSVVADVAGDSEEPADTDTVEPLPSPDRPGWFPIADEAADEWVELPGLSAPVRILYDGLGIPHIYGANPVDLARAQGYVTAQNRLFQMHTLRMAGSGRLAELLGSDALVGDALLRTLRLRLTAEEMTKRTKAEFPEAYGILEAFAAGANAWIDKVNAGQVPAPLEVTLFGITLDPWTVDDTLTITRLQTWDLGFGGILEPDDALSIMRGLQDTFGGTPLAGIVKDALNATPVGATATIDGAGAGKPGAGATSTGAPWLDSPFYQRFTTEMLERHQSAQRDTLSLPHHVLRGEDYGSNNWVVSGAHTESGKPIVNNDPHLSLRNPAIMFQVHASDVLAGGEFEVSGINFAGAPGIVLGHNRKVAWGATVFFSDVTDVYLEDLSADGKSVLFEGKEVALVDRIEVFDYQKPTDQPCEAAMVKWLPNLEPKVESTGDYTCRVTLRIQEVPHHGPVLPWSYGNDAQGKPVLMSWRWTGFEATDEMISLLELNKATNAEEVKAALDHFGVGAQNWVYGTTSGDIGWYPSHRLPIRANIAAGDYAHPPFFPMPGDGTAEWDGFVPRSELPQAHNPQTGYIVTANADPTGTSFDNDLFNDGHYLGFFWTAGLRMARASERVAAAVAKGGITPEDMMSIQADHHSNLGSRWTPALLAAIDAAADGSDPPAEARYTADMVQARALLAEWDFEAPSGVGAAPGSTEARSAAAAALFNVWVTFIVDRALADEGLDGPGDHLKARLLHRMITDQESMKTWDPAHGQSMIWDDQSTPDRVETRAEIMVLALADALSFLSNPDSVGVAKKGGFGTKDMDQWRWGALHTLTLAHNVLPAYDIPSADDQPDGFPRPGDMFGVDACHPGMGDRGFRYDHGPAVRHVMTLTDPIVRFGAVPGGQSEAHASPHYADQMALWVKNEAPQIPFELADVLAARERTVDLFPAAR